MVGEVANRRLALNEPAQQQKPLFARQQFQQARRRFDAVLEPAKVIPRRVNCQRNHRLTVEDAYARSSHAPPSCGFEETAQGRTCSVAMPNSIAMLMLAFLWGQGTAVVAQDDIDGRDHQDGQQGR